MWSVSPRENVAQIYRAVSLVLGVPSGLLFGFSAFAALQLWMLPPIKPDARSPTGNTLIDLLVAGASLVGKAFSLANNVAEWILTVVLIVSAALTVAAAALFMGSRGIHSGRAWARIAGVLVAIAPLAFSVLMITSFRRPVPAAMGAAGAIVSGYAIWVLGWRF